MVFTSPVDAAILVFLAILSICSETLLSLPYCLHLHIVLAIFAFVSGSVRIFVECHVLQGAQIRDSSFHLSPRSSSIHIPSLPISTALSILFRWSRLRWLFVNAARRLVRRSSGFVPVCGVCLLTLGYTILYVLQLAILVLLRLAPQSGSELVVVVRPTTCNLEISTPVTPALSLGALSDEDEVFQDLAPHHFQFASKVDYPTKYTKDLNHHRITFGSLLGLATAPTLVHVEVKDSAPSNAAITTNFVSATVDDLGFYLDIQKELGKGGYGQVYASTYKPMNKVIAVKRIELLPQDDFRAYKEIQAAYNEAYWLANLSHKNVLRSDGINIFVPDADAFILGMELLDGCSLTKPILDGRYLDVSAIACIASQLLHGLEYLQYQGAVHRDIKPDNIFICDDGIVKIIDLGLMAPAYQEDGPAGTPGFLAPEWYNTDGGVLPYGLVLPNLDTFALGVTVFELFTGRLPRIAYGEARQPDPERGPFVEYRPTFEPEVTRFAQESAVDFLGICLGGIAEHRPSPEVLLGIQHPFLRQACPSDKLYSHVVGVEYF